jgi:F-type H+-transporting ATPase subunit epsilon
MAQNMAKLHLQLVTPQRVVLNEELDSVSCPTTQGQITVLPGHIPLVATLASGELIARTGSGATASEHNIHVAGGFVEVRPGNQVIILADAAEHVYEIDEQEAETAQARAQDLLRKSNVSDEEYAMAATMLQRSISRLRVARKHARHGSGPRPVTSEGILKE